MEKKSPSLCSRLERAITSFLYNDSLGRSRAWRMGLQVPLWFWTHQLTVESEREGREVQKVVNLVRWFHDNGANVTQVAIIIPGEMKPRLRAELVTALQSGATSEELTLPILLGPHELTAMNARDHIVHQFEVVLYVLALPPVGRFLHVAKQQEQFLGDAIAGAGGAFILIGDVGWTSPHITVQWPQWRTFVMKLEEETPLVSSEGSAKLPDGARFSSLVGTHIPLCCARHVEQRQLEHGVAPIVRTCRRLCLQPFLCQRDGHVCMEPCHPRVSHANCPYACQTLMPCTHECLQSCSERCNCFEVHEHPLPCSHKAVIGMDKATMQPIYAEVRHIFKGYCADTELPCVVEYTTECARCLGPLMTTCSEARQHNHTLEQKTMLCSGCIRLEREVRAKVLGEILVKTEEAKRLMKVEMQRSLHQQRKASSQGLFQEGSRVTICDVLKIVKPLCADADFPGVKFVDYDAPDFYASMDGAYGTFVSRHVDIDDLSEVRNLIRLRDGQHVLVADGGVSLIRALTSNITQQAPVLLLTYNGGVANGGSGDRGVSASLNDSVVFAKTAKMIGRSYYLPVPVPCGDSTISDKIVRVTAVDPASPEGVVVECTRMSVIQHADEAHDGDHEGDDKSNTATSDSLACKRPRLEAAPPKSHHFRISVEALTFTVPAAVLEPIEGYAAGREVVVLDPTRQVTNPHDVEIFEAALAQMPGINMRSVVISTVPVGKDTSFILLGVVNSPSNLEKRYGPCAVLRRHVRLVTVRSGRRGRGSHGRLSTLQHVANVNGGAGDTMVVLVPFVFTAADELLEAENSLDAAAVEKFEQQVRDTIAERSEELAIRHDEEAFHQQRKMPEVTEEALAQDRFAYSIPIALPTAESLAGVRTRHARLLCASPTSLCLSKQKDALAFKQQQLGLNKWVEAMRTRYAQERAADVAYCKGLQLTAAMKK
ncbi:hypothetical protein TraAM80_04781 [Trypanosoma rangeli]|uniref:Uncharacterized protein n=1 Tax=Trypanosoma rangeli TaxID=5698 RepID=A0A3R7L0F4_TRYRA|nr:uncharacterized protein TraAM80_04781 [Trypanosoma rangeli]RNF05060.1 hypothetical protein TraAM80_04781 [Trypanosoma rangeli]|eukprot:RNF05060.1 hypothetical protein TraAM80_04781 [Trypanosoma rangeli]